ncbi:MAG: pyridoxamine 5'-phosphate oxidase family protein, partial [Bacteroidota bacterium]
MKKYVSDIAFTPAVKEFQEKEGSRIAYQRMAEQKDWNTDIGPVLEAFIAKQDSFYLASANVEGRPYIQHRGGAPGFLKVVDEHTLGFADYAGNRQ